jgi:hypothetical protein
MEISRERFLDDSRTYHFSLALRSRTTPAHSLLTSLSAEEREQVNAAIVTALNEIDRVVRGHLNRIAQI